MKKSKKIIAMLMVTIILMAQFTWVNFGSKTYAAETTIATKYFYNQLSDDAKVFYEAMETMMKAGYFKIGNASMEVDVLKLSEGKSSQELLDDMGAGRDAFMLDYPELFYVDFDYLSMRVEDGRVYLGTGRGDNYFNKEFLQEKFLKEDGTVDIDSSITTVNQGIKKIVDKAQTKESVEEQIKVAHDEIIKLTRYTYEYQTEHPYSVRTIYGVFGLGDSANAGNALCEGYARAFKAVLDRLDIPAILVRGAYLVDGNPNQPEEHMWVYVEIDGKWYGVDPTFDNGKAATGAQEKDETGVISDKYFLVGENVMYNHIPTGIISTSNFEFKYPTLEKFKYGAKLDNDHSDGIWSDGNGLVAEYVKEIPISENKSGGSIWHLSYNGKGLAKAIEEDGIYLLADFYHEDINENWVSSGMTYFDTVWTGAYTDYPTYLEVPMYGNINKFQFAYTDVNPKSEYDIVYYGGAKAMIGMTDIIENPHGDGYQAPPYIKRATPGANEKLYIINNKTYTITLEYDDEFINSDTKEKIVDYENYEIGYKVMIHDPELGHSEASEEKVGYTMSKPKLTTNVEGKVNTITFDFTPSAMWAYDSVAYVFEFSGIEGYSSHKAPMAASYVASYPCSMYAYTSQGYNMNVYGKPLPMTDFNLADVLDNNSGLSQELLDSLSDSNLGDLLKQRLALVTTTTTDKEDKALKSALDGKLANNDSDSIAKYETYNISLTLCNEQIKKLTDGQSIRIMLGFPEGYGPENEGVTFKAYHFTDDGKGGYIVEEIPCTITKLGLVIEVKSFSPFAIAALDATEELENTDKTITLNVTKGGKVITTNVATEKEQTVNVVHNYDYKYNENGTSTRVEDDKPSRTFTVKADDGYRIESVEIVKNVQKNANGKTIYETEKIELSNKNTFEVYYEKPENPENPENSEVIFIENSEVTFNVIFAAKDIEKQPVKVAPKTFTASAVASNNSKALKTGDTFDVTFSLDGTEGGFNISSIGGIFEYNSSNLELKNIESVDKVWCVKYNEDGTNQFIATAEPNSKSTVFKATFEVKEGAAGTAYIRISDLKAGTGGVAKPDTNPIAIADNLSLSIDIEEEVQDSNLVLKDTAASANITKKGAYIIMPAGMTEEQFRNYVETPSNPTITINPKPNLNPDKESTLPENTIKTGDSITVGNNTWTFSVRGDLDGDGIISVNDLAKAKLHFIGKEILTDAYLLAAETDGDNEPASVNDISRLKLVLINKIDDLFSNLRSN